ncbi:MAG: hypothetical protein PHE41_07005, partial [Eubacteriales bacterium]|nr:hypothetical protein [Eubacteriales bacterium]
MEDHKKENSISLSPLRISLLYIGVLMGAGFASGKEIWQFFGVFGGKGLFGIILISVIFISLGYIIVSISRALDTGDLSKIIVPFNNRLVENIIGGVVASFIFLGYFSMLAAGGAIAQEQLGIHRAIGSFILMVLVVLTIIKGFSRVSDRLGKVVPVLLITTLVLVFFIITQYFENISTEQVVTA